MEKEVNSQDELFQSVRMAGKFLRDAIEDLRGRFDEEGLSSDVTGQLSTLSNSYSRLVAETLKLERFSAQRASKMDPVEKDELALEHLISRPAPVIRYAIDELESAWTDKNKKHRKAE